MKTKEISKDIEFTEFNLPESVVSQVFGTDTDLTEKVITSVS